MKIALLGYGYWGPNIARNIQASERAELYAICDRSEDMLRKARAVYGDQVRYLTDYRALLDDPNVEGVALALRYDVSYPIAKEILCAGKHLFAEKPLAISSERALELGRLSEENGVTLHVDHILIYHPIIQYIKGMVDAGELGDILYFDFTRVNLGPHIKNDINAMWDLAVHDLAVLDHLCGGQTPRTVQSLGMRHYGPTEELTYLLLGYDKMVAFLKSSWVSPLKERTMIVCGTKKMVVFDDVKLDEKLMIYDKGIELPDDFTEYGRYEAKVRMGDMYAPYVPYHDALRASLEHFIDCAETSAPSRSGYPQAARVIRILEAADEQMRMRRQGPTV